MQKTTASGIKERYVLMLKLLAGIAVAFLGGLGVSIVHNYQQFGQFGYNLLLPSICAGLAILYFLYLKVRIYIENVWKSKEFKDE